MDYTQLKKMEEEWKEQKIELSKYLEEIYSFISGEDDTFVSYVTRIATTPGSEEQLVEILDDEKYSKGERFVAFYALCINYRRMKKYSQFKNILDRFNNVFNDEPIYWVQKAVYKKTFETNPEDLKEALKLWKNIDCRVKQMPAFVQAYADTVVLCFDNQVLSVENPKDRELLINTVELMENAISRRVYSKFYATLGKLLLLNGQYNVAIKNVKIAIDKESSDSVDYALRINEYELIITQINIKKSYDMEINKLKKYGKDIETVKDEIDKSKYDTLSFLGFFTALISFTMGSYQLAENVDFTQRVQLMLVLCGAIILAFSGLRIIVKSRSGGFRDVIFMVVLGVSIILAALLIIPVMI